MHMQEPGEFSVGVKSAAQIEGRGESDEYRDERCDRHDDEKRVCLRTSIHRLAGARIRLEVGEDRP